MITGGLSLQNNTKMTQIMAHCLRRAAYSQKSLVGQLIVDKIHFDIFTSVLFISLTIFLN